MNFSDRQRSILSILTSGPATVQTIADTIGAPDASVRRDVQVLRSGGHNINDARDNGGLYRLVA